MKTLPLYKAKCKTCGLVIRARSRDKLLRKIHDHYRKKHRSQLSRKIAEGRKRAFENPTLQDVFVEMKKSARSAYEMIMKYGPKAYKQVKQVMDAIEPMLDPELREKWRAVEAIHDAIQVLRKPIKRR